MTYGSVWLLQSSTKTSDSQQSLKLAVYNEFAILESFASNSCLLNDSQNVLGLCYI